MYNEKRADEMQPLLDASPILLPDAKDVALREWQRLTENLARVRSDIETLQAKEEALEAQVDAWAVILSAGGTKDTDDMGLETGTAIVRENRAVPNKQDSADAVVELLQEVGEPLHYRQIYEILTARGFEIKGKNPPNTLLARFFDDPRLERVRQGTYQIKSVEEVQQVD